jgi:uncharacterized protein (DUF169 family)
MPLGREDLAVLERLAFERPPVGVKFLPRPPEGLAPLNRRLALCEMLAAAQKGEAFFADAQSHACGAGAYVLGQAEAAGPFISGEFGAGLGIFEEPRAAARLYRCLPRIAPRVANHVAFAPLAQLAFDPDLLVLLADTRQAEILLRAHSYRTGAPWVSRFTAAIGCAWALVHPVVTGELNYFTTGFGHGMKRRGLFPEGRQLVSVPFDRLPALLSSLKAMPWVPPAFEPDGPAFVGRLLERLGVPPDR